MIGSNNPFYDAVKDRYMNPLHPNGMASLGQQIPSKKEWFVSKAEIKARLNSIERQYDDLARRQMEAATAAMEDEAQRRRDLLLLIC